MPAPVGSDASGARPSPHRRRTFRDGFRFRCRGWFRLGFRLRSRNRFGLRNRSGFHRPVRTLRHGRFFHGSGFSPPERGQPAREALAHQEEPPHEQEQQKQPGQEGAETTDGALHQGVAALSAETATEDVRQARHRRHERQQQRGQQRTGDRDKQRLEHRMVPASEQEADRHREEDDHQDETAQAEATPDQEIRPAETDGTGGIVCSGGAVQHRERPEALVGTPGEQVGEGRQKREHGEHGDRRTGDPDQPLLVIVVHVAPECEQFHLPA